MKFQKFRRPDASGKSNFENVFFLVIVKPLPNTLAILFRTPLPHEMLCDYQYLIYIQRGKGANSTSSRCDGYSFLIVYQFSENKEPLQSLHFKMRTHLQVHFDKHLQKCYWNSKKNGWGLWWSGFEVKFEHKKKFKNQLFGWDVKDGEVGNHLNLTF